METRILPQAFQDNRTRIVLTVLVALLAGIASYYFSHLTGSDAGDFHYSLAIARDWLAGKDPYLPYKLNLDPSATAYPFTVVPLSLPFVWLPERIAASIFSALGSAILAWLSMGKGNTWRIFLFASWPFYNSLLFTQWVPYIVSMFFTPTLLFFLLVKPQLALPFAVIQKPNRLGLILAAALLVTSLALFPLWPIDWIKNINMGNYTGFSPLFFLPLGPLLLLALLRYRDKRAWLLLLMAAMPQRMVYDQLGVLLVAKNRKQLIFLAACSWLTLPALVYYQGYGYLPYGWQNWIMIESYLPALIIVLLPLIKVAPAKLKGLFVLISRKYS